MRASRPLGDDRAATAGDGLGEDRARHDSKHDSAPQDLAERINAAHNQAHQSAHTAIEHAIECGRLLLEAKASVAHGGWLPWIEANLSFGARQAQKYLRLAAFIEQHPNTKSNAYLTIDGALAAIAEPAQKPSRAKPKPKWEPATPRAEQDAPAKRPDLVAVVRDLNVTWAPAAIESTVAVLTEQQRADLQQHLPDVIEKLQRLAEPARDADPDEEEAADEDLDLPRSKRPPSRPKRWADACARASEALEELRELQDEYRQWRETLPENLECSAIAEKLDAIDNIDLDAVIQVVEEAEGADLPLGFGRD